MVMESLFAQADAIRPVQKRKRGNDKDKKGSDAPENKGKDLKGKGRSKKEGKEAKADDHTLASVKASTGLPRSLRPSSPPPEGTSSAKKQHAHVKNPHLRRQLVRRSELNARSKTAKEGAAMVTEAVGAESGMVEVEGDMERTWRLSQSEIEKEVGLEAARGRKEWVLDGGPYRVRYTRNGRYVNVHC